MVSKRLAGRNNMEEKLVKPTAHRIKQRASHLAYGVSKSVAGFFALIIVLFCAIGWMVNHMSSSGEIKRFVAGHEVVHTMVGAIKADDVVIHSLTEFSTNGELSVHAVAVATGSQGQVRVAIDGIRSASDDPIRMALRGIQPVRCHLVFVCSDVEH